MADVVAVAADVPGAMPDPVTASNKRAAGGCLCGGVTYTVHGELDNIIGCHCEQCRKTSGHYVAATRVSNDGLVITQDQTLAWYQSSQNAKRGFCTRCGGNLFWKNTTRDSISIMAGTLNVPTHLTLTHHIFVADASDYVSFRDEDVFYDQDE